VSGAIFSGGPEFSAALARIAVAVERAAADAVMKGAHMIEASAKAHSSGRPGPNVPSGSHRRSIHVEGPTVSGGQIRADIGPSMIYSRRLELGYDDMTDALGRVYHQKPLPYLDPALAEVTPRLNELISVTVGAAIEGA
jgi:hypothetical protein